MNFSNENISRKIEYYSGQEQRQKNRVLIFFIMMMVVVMIGVVLCIGAFCVGSFVEIIKNSPNIDDIDKIKPTAAKSIVYAADDSVMQELVQSGSNRISVTYDQIPKDLINAIVAIEDSRFFTHDGVDVKGIIRAIAVGLTSGNLSEGASTLTQQLIKNNVFNGGMEDNVGERIERKFQEQYLALRAERELTKDEILQDYLNTINLGSNCLGVQVASKRYFAKDVWNLDLSECTVLACITNNPSRYNPITHPEKNQVRREKVLRLMLENEMITEEQYTEALSEDVYKRIQTVAEARDSETHAFSYFTDYVFEDVAEALQERLGYTDTQAFNALYSSGLRIYTTMDPKIQDIVDQEINNHENYVVFNADGSVTDYYEFSLDYRLTVEVPGGNQYYYDETNVKNYFQDVLEQSKFRLTFDSEEALTQAAVEFRDYILERSGGTVVNETISSIIEPQASIVIMDQKTGHVLAVSGGRGDKDKLGSLTLNRATASTRQPGSTFKVISTYAPAIDTDGQTLGSTYYDAPVTYGDKSISNWWGSQYMGYSNIRFAIQSSMNVVAVKCLEETVTENTAYNYVTNFGITTVVPEDKSPVFTLGGLKYGTTNLEMTAAYAAIANDGVYVKPIFWTKVTDADGNIILENAPETRTVLRTSSARLLTSAMESSVTPPFVLWPSYGVTATNTACAVPHMAIAGKSGTTSDANDLWFIGYSPYYTMGIWSGYDSSKSFGESPGYHKVIWQKIMSKIHEDLPEMIFNYEGLEKVLICSKSGLLAKAGVCDASEDENCHVYEEYFAKGTAPVAYCDRHTVFNVCTSTGMLSTASCPPQGVISKVCLIIDPEDKESGDTDDTLYTAPDGLTSAYCTLHSPQGTSQTTVP